MKNKLFKIFICILLVGTFFLITPDMVSGDDLVEGDYTYSMSNGEATITRYMGDGGAIVIPSTLGGYATVAIGNNAFYKCQSLTSVIIPNSVTTIGDYAFDSCSSLTSITIPDSVITIKSDAFSSCSSLTSVTIGSSVITIEAYAFRSCTALASMTIGTSVTTIKGYAFSYCTNLTSITFLGLVAPTSVGVGWITNTPVEIRGHAYATSNFPTPGDVWHGLTMGTVIGSENKPPVASFIWTPSNSNLNQEITFDASVSNDPDGSIISYEWDWNNDGVYEESHTTPTATHSWTQAGNYFVTVRVTDNDGSTSTKKITVPVSSGGGDGNGDTDNKGTPGFELVFVLSAIAVVILLWRKKRIV
jgi:hypothetical protein